MWYVIYTRDFERRPLQELSPVISRPDQTSQLSAESFQNLLEGPQYTTVCTHIQATSIETLGHPIVSVVVLPDFILQAPNDALMSVGFCTRSYLTGCTRSTSHLLSKNSLPRSRRFFEHVQVTSGHLYTLMLPFRRFTAWSPEDDNLCTCPN